MEKVFTFGKVDYYRKGRKENLVTVKVKYREKDNGKYELGICGNIWNRIKSDILCGGQCLDTIAEYVKTREFKTLYRLWELYHLNDMRPYCEHQKELNWDKIASKKVNIYKYKMKKQGIAYQVNEYELDEIKYELLGRLRENEHPEGILSKSCPVCGYEYGSLWVYHAIPQADHELILSLFAEGDKNVC